MKKLAIKETLKWIFAEQNVQAGHGALPALTSSLQSSGPARFSGSQEK